jgi:hypothetical protein
MVDATSGLDIFAYREWRACSSILDVLSSSEEGVSPTLFGQNERSMSRNRI